MSFEMKMYGFEMEQRYISPRFSLAQVNIFMGVCYDVVSRGVTHWHNKNTCYLGRNT